MIKYKFPINLLWIRWTRLIMIIKRLKISGAEGIVNQMGERNEIMKNCLTHRKDSTRSRDIHQIPYYQMDQWQRTNKKYKNRRRADT